MTDVPAERIKRIINRLYGYLKRFVLEDGLVIDIIYIMSNIVFGDTIHQNRIKEVLGL